MYFFLDAFSLSNLNYSAIKFIDWSFFFYHWSNNDTVRGALIDQPVPHQLTFAGHESLNSF